MHHAWQLTAVMWHATANCADELLDDCVSHSSHWPVLHVRVLQFVRSHQIAALQSVVRAFCLQSLPLAPQCQNEQHFYTAAKKQASQQCLPTSACPNVQRQPYFFQVVRCGSWPLGVRQQAPPRGLGGARSGIVLLRVGGGSPARNTTCAWHEAVEIKPGCRGLVHWFMAVQLIVRQRECAQRMRGSGNSAFPCSASLLGHSAAAPSNAECIYVGVRTMC
ncbi:hypothetical protein COO60DRAFT_350605 [Scenedesmus sp. NREL 46B-D3]|nr:hypothetical protein COO60DRAFT_350605 [Scenedesmus sp. NREL 46B-D3]